MVYHILIIPSEEFQPAHSKLAGIFQLHQAKALKEDGNRIGIISIRQDLSIPMIFRHLLLKLTGKKVHISLRELSVFAYFKLLYQKIFSISNFISEEEIEEFLVYRINGFYFLPPNEKTNHYGWLKAGNTLFKHYVKVHGKPDIIHAHNALNAGLLAHSLSNKYKIPYLITEHSSYFFRGLVPKSLYPSVRKAYQSASNLIVVSPFLGKELQRIIGVSANQWKWIPNVLEKEFEQLARNTKTSNVKSPFIFFCLGSFIPIKGHLMLIQAFAKAFDEKNPVELHIYGGGPLKEELEEAVSGLNRGQQIIIGGRINRKEVITKLKESHCFVLPSEVETFGVVLIEAMTLGLPVIATKCGGPEIVVNDTNGILIAPKDEKALEKALVKMFRKSSSYSSMAIQKYVLDNFSGAIVSQKLMTEYKNTNVKFKNSGETVSAM